MREIFGDMELPRDYKFFCFDGEPKFICRSDRGVNTKFDFMILWNKLAVSQYYPNTLCNSKPENLIRYLSWQENCQRSFHM